MEEGIIGGRKMLVGLRKLGFLRRCLFHRIL